MSNISATSMSWWEQVTFWWDDDDVLFVLDQHTWLDFYSAGSLKQQPTGRLVDLTHTDLEPTGILVDQTHTDLEPTGRLVDLTHTDLD